MNLMPQEVEYTLARHPRASKYAKINEALCMIVCSGNLKEYLSYGSTQLVENNLTHNHCEVHCNMIVIVWLDYTDIQ